MERMLKSSLIWSNRPVMQIRKKTKQKKHAYSYSQLSFPVNNLLVGA